MLLIYFEDIHVNITIAPLGRPRRPFGTKDASQVGQPGIRGGRPGSVEQPASRHPVIWNCHCIQESPEDTDTSV